MEIKRRIYCLCGCGQRTKIGVNGKRNKFIPGHNLRVPLDKKTEQKRREKISKSLKNTITKNKHLIEIRKETWKGKKHTKESKRKMSIAAKQREKEKKENGYVVPESTRLKISKALKGRKLTQETLDKISKANKGKIRSKEVKRLISKKLAEYYEIHDNPFKGKRHTKETIQKLREANKDKFKGEKGPNWRGGVSFYPYPIKWNLSLKKLIKDRDKNKCQNPNCKDKTKILDVHHIDYDKENCNPKNLITLCKQCHGQTNYSRNYWRGFYSAIIEKQNKPKIRRKYV